MRATIRRGDDLFARGATFVGVVLALVAIGVRFVLGPPLEPLFFVGVAFLAVAPFFRSRTRMREAVLELTPGRLTVRPSGRGLTQTIAMKELTGASTAHADDGVTLVLATDPRFNPVLVSLDDTSRAKEACDALGVGKAGFGVLVWERGPRPTHHVVAAIRLLGALYALATCAYALTSDSFAAQLDVNSNWTLVAVGMLALVTLSDLVVPRRTIALRPNALHLFDDRARSFPWSTIETVDVRGDAFVFTVVQPHGDHEFPRKLEVTARFSPPARHRQGIEPVDAGAIVAQIRAAVARSRGGPLEAEHFNSVVGLLQPLDNEATIDWIRRLDALADGWRVSPPRHGETESYRVALWSTLEDHDADPIVRALATRVLSRLDRASVEPKLRVVLETVRDKQHVAHLRAAVAPESEPLAAAIEEWKRRA